MQLILVALKPVRDLGPVGDFGRKGSLGLFVCVCAVFLSASYGYGDGYEPSSEHYNVEGSFGGFTIDRISHPPRMKYDWSSEIFVLSETPGPRGATFYKLDTGQNVLAETSSGSFILYTKIFPQGVPTTWTQSVGRLHRPSVDLAESQAQIYRVEERLNDKLRREIRFVLDWDRLSDDVRFRINATDVAQIAGVALLELIEDPEMAKLIRKQISEIRIVEAKQTAISLNDETLFINFVGTKGVMGRYSSHQTALVIKGKL